jgi:hypothetical protein
VRAFHYCRAQAHRRAARPLEPRVLADGRCAAKYMGSLSAPRSLSLFDGLLLSGSDDIHPVSAHDSMNTSLRAGAMSSRWSSTKIHLTWVH